MEPEVRPRKKRPKDRRQQILNVAAELIATRGFAAASIQEIGERTGITGGAIYRHFPSKNALLEAVLEDTISMWLSRVTAVRAEAAASQQPLLRSLITDALTMVETHRGRVATYVREFHRVEPPRLDEIRQIEVKVARGWRDAILESQPALSRSETAARQQAALGALSALSRRPAVLGTAGVSAALVDALEAAMSSPLVLSERPQTPAKTWVGPVTRRQQIVSTATRLFSQSGFHGAGFSEVGEAVGIAGPSIYEYFESKTDILLEAYEQAFALLTAGSLLAVRRATSADHAVDLLIESLVDICFEFADLIVVASQESASVPDDVRPRLIRRRRDLHERWIQVLREVRPSLTTTKARVLVQTMFAIVLQVARMPLESRPSAEAHVALVRAFLAVRSSPSHDEVPDLQATP